MTSMQTVHMNSDAQRVNTKCLIKQHSNIPVYYSTKLENDILCGRPLDHSKVETFWAEN